MFLDFIPDYFPENRYISFEENKGYEFKYEKFYSESKSIIDEGFLMDVSQISNVSIGLDVQIAKQLEDQGYQIAKMHQREIKELGQVHEIYTYELFDEIENYRDLLKKEQVISESLGLYDKNIILEVV